MQAQSVFKKSLLLSLTLLATTAISGCGNLEKAKNGMIISNMRTVQVAAQEYAAANGGRYPSDIDDAFKSYLPGGGKDGKTPAPNGMENPFNSQKEWPVMGSISDVQSVRNAAPPALDKGKIEYSVFDGGFAVIGGGGDNKAVPGDSPDTTLVMSNK